ncbi:unnamed protein product, partial [Medioppia subpectinata]
MHGCVLWDNQSYYEYTAKSGELKVSQTNGVSDLYNWQDSRCDHQFIASLPTPDSYATRVSSGFGCATIFWINKHSPQLLSQFNSGGTVMDFIVAVLCGLKRPVMSTQNAMSWGYFDPIVHSWNEYILKANDFPIHLLPIVKKSGSVAGETQFNWLGIEAKTPVLVALGDMQCATYANLRDNPNNAVLSISTSMQMSVLMDKSFTPVKSKTISNSSIDYFPYFDDSYLSVAASLNGGNVLQHLVQFVRNTIKDMADIELSDEQIWAKIFQLHDTVPKVNLNNELISDEIPANDSRNTLCAPPRRRGMGSLRRTCSPDSVDSSDTTHTQSLQTNQKPICESLPQTHSSPNDDNNVILVAKCGQNTANDSNHLLSNVSDNCKQFNDRIESLSSPLHYTSTQIAKSYVRSTGPTNSTQNTWNRFEELFMQTMRRWKSRWFTSDEAKATRKRRLSRFLYYIKTILTHLFSTTGLCLLVIAYSCMGAFIFAFLESQHEEQTQNDVEKQRQDFAIDLWNQTNTLNILYPERWINETNIRLKKFEEIIVKAVREDGYGGTSEQWTFSGALLYSVTVITTIGPTNSTQNTWNRFEELFMQTMRRWKSRWFTSDEAKATRKRRLSRFLYYIKTILTHLFSTTGLCLLVIAYSCMGAFIFAFLESQHEEQTQNDVEKQRQDFAIDLWNQTNTLNILYPERWINETNIRLKKFEEIIVKAVREDGYGGTSEQWTFSGALLYSVTVITTI